ncbi:hypothetical protein V1514DRAFT_327123 [Lipomyces japonicus]|uniref:uncharacterized protein n=1 Tax=Lipomyces japonicus TaxID=56871 RepID=UPI0034CFFEA7
MTSGSSTRGGTSNYAGSSSSASSGKRGTVSTTATSSVANSQLNVDDLNGFSDPIDFETFPRAALRKYKAAYNLSTPSSVTFSGSLLDSSVGKRTYSFKHRNRVSKDELASDVKRHFTSVPVRETDMIAGFIYAAKYQKNAFKLRFPAP